MQEIINTSHQYKCIFIHIPKVAGTSIKQALGLPGGGHPPWQYFYQSHLQLWRQYTSFTVVRNPWDRLVSAYRYAQMKESYWHNEKVGFHPDHHLLKDKPFKDFVLILHDDRGRLKHESWFNQTDWLAGTNPSEKKIMTDTVLRFETLARDFNKLCRQLGIPPKKLPVKNRSKRGRDYRQYYNENTRKIVADIYESDIDIFRYTFHET